MLSIEGSILDLKRNLSPEQFARTLRSGGKIFWWEPGGFFVVTDYKLAEKILKDQEFSADRSSFFISRMPNLDLSLIRDFFSIVGKMMVMSDGDEHQRRRKAASIGLDEDLLEYYKPFVSHNIGTLLDKLETGKEVEFVSEIAEILPASVLADLFHIPIPDRKSFYEWSNNMTQFFGGASQYRNEDGISVNNSAVALRKYFETLVKNRRGSGGNDFVSTVLSKQGDYGLSNEELVSQMIMMLVAGQITTTDQICHNLFQLLSNTKVKSELLKKTSLLQTALEEFNRLDPAVTFLFRLAKRDLEMDHLSIPKGGTLFISTHAIHRDPEVFPNPDQAVMDRNPNPHFAYGHGAHFCLGAKLARIQMVELFSQLLRRFPNIGLVENRSLERKHESLAFSGFKTLWIRSSSSDEDDLVKSIGIPAETVQNTLVYV